MYGEAKNAHAKQKTKKQIKKKTPNNVSMYKKIIIILSRCVFVAPLDEILVDAYAAREYSVPSFSEEHNGKNREKNLALKIIFP